MKQFKISLAILAIVFAVGSSFKPLEVRYFEYLGSKPASSTQQTTASNYGTAPIDETTCTGTSVICAAQFNWDGFTRGSQILNNGNPVVVLGDLP